MDTEETFESYVRGLGGARVQIEVVTGRVIEGKILGVHPDWIQLVDEGRSSAVLRIAHVVAFKVLEPAKRVETKTR